MSLTWRTGPGLLPRTGTGTVALPARKCAARSGYGRCAGPPGGPPRPSPGAHWPAGRRQATQVVLDRAEPTVCLISHRSPSPAGHAGHGALACAYFRELLPGCRRASGEPRMWLRIFGCPGCYLRPGADAELVHDVLHVGLHGPGRPPEPI